MNTINGDVVLWELFRQGDKEAFGNFFRTHYSSLFQFGSKVADDIPMLEDCIQELFVELWQAKLPAPKYSIRAYLIKALKYKLLRSLRGKLPLDSLRNADEYHFELSHENFLIAEQDDVLRADRVKAAITSLSNRQKEIIYLRYYQNLDYEEICSVMDLNYQAARNLLSQSIKSLKKIFVSESFAVMLLLCMFFL